MSQTPDPPPDDRLALSADSAGLDRAVRADLDKIRFDALLAHQDASTDLTRAIEDSVRAPLAVAEISGVLDRLESPVFTELAGLLDSTEASGLQMEKHLLKELLNEGAGGQAILKRGLTFVKHKRFKEAVEWWTLNRRNLDAATSRLHLFLLIMESLTHFWAGDHERAAATRDQVRAHKLFPATASRPERGLGARENEPFPGSMRFPVVALSCAFALHDEAHEAVADGLSHLKCQPFATFRSYS